MEHISQGPVYLHFSNWTKSLRRISHRAWGDCLEERKPLGMNVSLQSTSPSKGTCDPELVRKCKVRHLISLPQSREEKKWEKIETTTMIPSLRADECRWLPLIRWPVLTQWKEKKQSIARGLCDTLCSPGRREVGLTRCGPEASIRTSWG